MQKQLKKELINYDLKVVDDSYNITEKNYKTVVNFWKEWIGINEFNKYLSSIEN